MVLVDNTLLVLGMEGDTMVQFLVPADGEKSQGKITAAFKPRSIPVFVS